MTKLRRMLIVCFTALLLFSAYKICGYMRESWESQAAIAALKEKAIKERSSEEKRDDEISFDFEALQKECPQAVGWLFCPDTVISYPVLQAKDNEYYLRRLPDGSYNIGGTLFLDYRCASDFTDGFSMIYGHNMKNGSMFGLLPRYKSQAYYEKHPVWYLLTPKKSYRVELIAGYVTSADSRLYSLPGDSEACAALGQEAFRQSDFTPKIRWEAQDRLVAFSTCSYEYDSARYVLVGALREIP